MKNETLPSWKETRQEIHVKTGADFDTIDQKANDVKTKMGAFISTDDFLYYYTAKTQFGMDLPAFKQVAPQADAPERTPALDLSFLELYEADGNTLYNTSGVLIEKSVKTAQSGNSRVELRFNDGQNGITIVAFKDDRHVELMDLKVGNGYDIKLLGAYISKGTNGYKDKTTVTINRATTFEPNGKTFDDYSVNAATTSPNSRQLTHFRGIVTSENTHVYEGCSVCKRSVKNGPCQNHTGTESVDYTLYSAIVSDGNSKVPCNFMYDGPQETIWGSAVYVGGTWDSKDNGINVTFHEIVVADVIDAHSKKVSKIIKTTQTSEEPTLFDEPKIGATTPSGVIEKFLKNYGSNPPKAVVSRLVRELRITGSDAEGIVEDFLADGVIVKDGANLKWVGHAH